MALFSAPKNLHKIRKILAFFDGRETPGGRWMKEQQPGGTIFTYRNQFRQASIAIRMDRQGRLWVGQRQIQHTQLFKTAQAIEATIQEEPKAS